MCAEDNETSGHRHDAGSGPGQSPHNNAPPRQRRVCAHRGPCNRDAGQHSVHVHMNCLLRWVGAVQMCNVLLVVLAHRGLSSSAWQTGGEGSVQLISARPYSLLASLASVHGFRFLRSRIRRRPGLDGDQRVRAMEAPQPTPVVASTSNTAHSRHASGPAHTPHLKKSTAQLVGETFGRFSSPAPTAWAACRQALPASPGPDAPACGWRRHRPST